jgi:exosome complex RNA-binding protein Rrp42 (RNase PH superfamily)
MSTFEKIYLTDPSRENRDCIDKHLSIEMSDSDYISSRNKSSKKMDTTNHEKDTPKIAKRRTKKANPKCYEAAMESLQEQLS